MINLTKYPEAVVLAGNKVLVNATGTKMYLNDGTYAKLNLMFWLGGAIANGQTFTLTWGNNSVVIVFRTVLTGEGFEFPSTPSIDFEYVVAFRTFMLGIYAISRDFFIPETTWFAGPSILCSIKANEKSNDFTIAVSGNTVPNTAITDSTQAGSAPEIRSGYQHIFQLYDITGQLIGEEAITPDASQKSVFDASEYLYNKIELNRTAVAGFSFPVQEDKIFERGAQALRFYVRYAEKWDQQVQTLHTAATCTALMGGLSKIKEAEFANYGTTFSAMLDDDQFFLTWQPVTKRTSLAVPERLFFYNNTNRTINLRFKAYLYDGTTYSTGDFDFLTFQASAGKVYEFDVSGMIFAATQSPIDKYEVWLEDGSGVRISEIRTYQVDYTFYRNEQHFIFRNSLGGFDTVRCTGRLKRQGEIDRETFTDDDNYRHSLTNLMEITYTAETGSVSAEMFRWLDDLMLSKEAYWLTSGRALPVIITNKKSTELVDDQRRFNISFDFSLSALETYSAAPSTSNAVLEELTGNNNGNINA